MNPGAWFRVFGYAPMRVFMKILAPFAYPFIDKRYDPIWGSLDTNDYSFWNIAIRNGAHNFTSRRQPAFRQSGNALAQADWSLEAKSGFQWRRRESLDGQYVSFRMTWGEPRKTKGKREFYIGWTMDTAKTLSSQMRLTFFQIRPAWIFWGPVVLGIGYWWFG